MFGVDHAEMEDSLYVVVDAWISRRMSIWNWLSWFLAGLLHAPWCAAFDWLSSGGKGPGKEHRCVEFTDFVACSVDFFEKVEGFVMCLCCFLLTRGYVLLFSLLRFFVLNVLQRCCVLLVNSGFVSVMGWGRSLFFGLKNRSWRYLLFFLFISFHFLPERYLSVQRVVFLRKVRQKESSVQDFGNPNFHLWIWFRYSRHFVVLGMHL